MALSDFNVYLEDNYGLDHTLGVSQLRDVFPGATDADKVDAAGVVFPWFLAYCSCDSARFGVGVPDRVPTPGAPAWTDTEMADLSYAVAAHNDAVWTTGGAINQAWYFGAPPLSRANIIWPHGSYYINYPLIAAYGTIEGQGAGSYAPDLNSPLSQVCGGTRLSIWHEEWLDIPGGDNGPVKNIIQSLNWPVAVGGTLYAGVLGATGGGATTVLNNYMEGLKIKNLRFEGRKSAAPEAVDSGATYVTTYEDAGMAIWRFGSGSGVFECQGYSFNNAVYTLASGVPAYLEDVHGFDCNYASVWMRGDGMFTITGLEVDESPTAIKAEGFIDPTNPASYLITPGAKFAISGVKVETGTSGVPARYKGTMLFDGVGWCRGTINGVSYASSNIYPELLCRIEPYPSGFTSTNSYLKLTGLGVFGFVRTLMHHSVSSGQNKKWLLDKGMYTVKYNESCGDFTYNSSNGGTCKTDSGDNITLLNVAGQNRQEFLILPLLAQTWTDNVDPMLPVYTNPSS